MIIKVDSTNLVTGNTVKCLYTSSVIIFFPYFHADRSEFSEFFVISNNFSGCFCYVAFLKHNF